ncbi:MAG: phage integrase N-terminal SAM-like domain-containing protein [Bacteroidetes bacterium]|nr:phage integrase N-terminal SAM-like domain-containing protein [Bacteroidota bacterium]MBL0140472.1 phage integrase N-terminal SAM-like domain-containing protein [Bacteroidota bacterium]
MSTLRNNMIQQMELKGFSPLTIKVYIFHLLQLSKHFNTSPDLLSVEQIRTYLHQTVAEKMQQVLDEPDGERPEDFIL